MFSNIRLSPTCRKSHQYYLRRLEIVTNINIFALTSLDFRSKVRKALSSSIFEDMFFRKTFLRYFFFDLYFWKSLDSKNGREMIIIVCNLFFTFVVANPCVPDPCQNSGVCTYTVRFYGILVTTCHQHHLHLMIDLNIRTLRRRTIHVYALLRHLVPIVRSQVDFKYFHNIACKNEAFDDFKNKVKMYVTYSMLEKETTFEIVL